jgi:hypothetical protein
MRRLAILALISCSACATDAAGPATGAAGAPAPARAAVAAPAQPAGQQSPTLTQLRALIGNAACTGPAECRTVPIGARACGGPETYLAWSTAQTRPDALRALAERYKAERQAQIQARGEISDCRFAVDPGAVCQAGTCQLGQGALQAR